ncbi:TonB-dependent receptor [Abyssalbus ytuae]|uniref:TonB-dependent receptor n=1 Tax=Abyssalbus ytuae TaxID=2926907 RepID=A0A9E7CTF0_9FLAO|nr:TonB-dependent receptor [Abyssalbus ytuae]UOB16062.1 TonB-dependent receptor [Abyssalbus ytuae]
MCSPKFQLFFILISFIGLSYAQEKTNLRGRVVEKQSGSPVGMATLLLKDTGKWAVTDGEGSFVISQIEPGPYVINFSCLGYADKELTVVVEAGMASLTIGVEELSLSLSEVVVTAQEKKLNTISKIEQNAIRHIQPKSLADIFQLLPGHITENPTEALGKPAQIKIREMEEDNNSALGAAIIVDGVPLSNNANLQITSTSKSGTLNTAPTVAGMGIDLRGITTENIESVEVIRGIPSAEYGDLTSGAVIVKTKAGKTPYEAKIALDPNTKIFYLSKGFLLNNEKGSLNFGIDYTESYPDLHLKYEGFKRITGNLGYSNTFLKNSKPLSLNAKLSYFETVDEIKSDPELKSEEAINSSFKGFRAGLNGMWQLNLPWLTNLSYNFSGSYTHNEDYIKNLQTVTAGTMPLATSYDEGEHEADFIPSEYYSEMTIDGKPFNIFAQIKGNTAFNIGNWHNNLKLGVEWRTDGNNGKGKQFDINYPPTINSISTLRPRSYKDIPSLNTLSMFVENKLYVPIGFTEFTGQIGLRYNNTQPKGLFTTNGATTMEPRMNLRYQFLNQKNNKVFDDLALRFGYGVAAKMPTLLHLYPDKAYFDETSFNYYDGDEGSLAVITTKIIEDTGNPNLKPSYNHKLEAGLDFTLGKVSGKITAYREKQTGGFNFKRVPIFLTHQEYQVEGSGKNPFFVEGEGVYYYENDEIMAATSVQDTAFDFYNIPKNDQVRIKKGIEYTFNLGNITPISTDLIVDGAWFYTDTYNTRETYQRFSTLYQGDPFPYIAVYPAGEKKVRQRLNTNIRAITHIPSIKMVVSLTAQLIWFDKTQYLYEDEDGNSYVYVTRNNEKVDVENVYTYQGENVIKNVAPTGYIDLAGNYYEWDPSLYQEQPYRTMVNTYIDSYFLEENLPFVAQLNIRLTKELAHNLDLSFMANNFLNHRPYHKRVRVNLYQQRNSRMYFGAEIKFKF